MKHANSNSYLHKSSYTYTFFYKNPFYKNHEAQNRQKIKNIIIIQTQSIDKNMRKAHFRSSFKNINTHCRLLCFDSVILQKIKNNVQSQSSFSSPDRINYLRIIEADLCKKIFKN